MGAAACALRWHRRCYLIAYSWRAATAWLIGWFLQVTRRSSPRSHCTPHVIFTASTTSASASSRSGSRRRGTGARPRPPREMNPLTPRRKKHRQASALVLLWSVFGVGIIPREKARRDDALWHYVALEVSPSNSGANRISAPRHRRHHAKGRLKADRLAISPPPSARHPRDAKAPTPAASAAGPERLRHRQADVLAIVTVITMKPQRAGSGTPSPPTRCSSAPEQPAKDQGRRRNQQHLPAPSFLNSRRHQKEWRLAAADRRTPSQQRGTPPAAL